jgi:Tol biopolymer transport system component
MARQIRIRTRRPRVLVAAMGIVSALGIAGPSQGVSPGENGRIAFSWSHEHVEGVGSTHIASVRPDGSGFKDVTAGSYGVHASAPDWSSNGRKIAFAFMPDESPQSIYVARPDGSHWKKVTGSKGFSVAVGEPTWAPNSKRLAYARDHDTTRRSEIMRIDVDGTNKVNLTSNKRFESSPDWSSTGRIVYVRRNSGPAEIYAMGDNGKNVDRLTNNDVPDRQPAWSPDGGGIVWQRGGTLFRMNARGRHVVNLGVNGRAPTWSPDGEKIAFATHEGIYVMNDDGSEVELIMEESELGPAGSDIDDLDWRAVAATG